MFLSRLFDWVLFVYFQDLCDVLGYYYAEI